MLDVKKFVSWIVKIGLLIVPILPLVVTRSLFFPFITGRNFIFRIIIEVIFVFWIWLMMSDSAYRPRSSPIIYSFIALMAVLFLATIFGISPYKSFWSSFERMEGFWAFWHYFLYFLMLISVFKKADWQKFFLVSAAASLSISFYALLQLLGKLSVHQGSVRLDATMGNATYLAIYLIFHVAFFLFVAFKTSNLWLRLGSLAAGLFELFIVYHTATRGAILGFLVGLVIWSILNAIYSKNKSRKLAIGTLVGLVLVPIIFLIFINTNFVQSSQTLSRFASLSLTETTTQSRFLIWNMAYQAWKERPVLGWGPESFVYIFSKYYDARMWQQEPWFDRAHNVFFDWLTSSGVVGLAAYLSLFASGVFALYKIFRASVLKIELAGIIVGLLVAYFIHNIFVFDNFTSYIIFFALLAYLHWLYIEHKSPTLVSGESNYVPLGLRYGVTVVVAVSVIFSVYFFNIKPIWASQSIIDTLQTITYSRDGSRERNLAKGTEILEKSISYNTFGTAEIREQLAQYAVKINQDPATPREDKQKFVSFALDQMKTQAAAFPYDVRAKAFLSTLYGEAGDNANAILTAQDGLAISRQRQQFYFLLGEAYFKAGEEDLAIEAMKSAYDLAPEYPDAIHNYAVMLIFSGHPAEAEAMLKKHFGVEIYPDAKYVNAYAALGDFKKLTMVWEKLVQADSNNAQYRLSLASAYVKTFRDQEAIKQLEKAIELAPQFKDQGEAFIKQIKEGKLKR